MGNVWRKLLGVVRDRWRNLPARRRVLIAIAGMGLPPVVLVVLLLLFAVNVPFWDQWELVPYIEKMLAGTLGISDLMAQHNEHRMLFPRLIMLTAAWLTHWNTLAEVGINLTLAVATFVLLWLMIRKTFGMTLMAVLVGTAVSIVVFSPIQFENWLWGWQIQWYVHNLGVVAAIWGLCFWKAKPMLRLGVGMLGALVAMFSLASGFFVWIVCLPLLFANKQLRPFMWWWIAAAVMAALAYFIGYQKPPHHPSTFLFLSQFGDFLAYIGIYLSLPIAVHAYAAGLVAVAYVGTWAVALWLLIKHAWRETGHELLPWLCLGAYAVLTAASTAAGRVGFGVGQAYSSRYATIAVLLVIALIVVLAMLARKLPVRRLRYVAMACAVAVVLLASVTFVKGAVQLQRRHDELVRTQNCAQHASSVTDPCLHLLYPTPEIVWPRLQYLRSIDWGGL